jgi:hypothetical protein
MVRALDDLDIECVNWLKPEENGKLGYSCENCFRIWISCKLRERKIIKTLIHELEHYELTKLLLSWAIPAWLHPFIIYPEWVHSNPSGIWKLDRGTIYPKLKWEE